MFSASHPQGYRFICTLNTLLPPSSSLSGKMGLIAITLKRKTLKFLGFFLRMAMVSLFLNGLVQLLCFPFQGGDPLGGGAYQACFFSSLTLWVYGNEPTEPICMELPSRQKIFCPIFLRRESAVDPRPTSLPPSNPCAPGSRGVRPTGPPLLPPPLIPHTGPPPIPVWVPIDPVDCILDRFRNSLPNQCSSGSGLLRIWNLIEPGGTLTLPPSAVLRTVAVHAGTWDDRRPQKSAPHRRPSEWGSAVHFEACNAATAHKGGCMFSVPHDTVVIINGFHLWRPTVGVCPSSPIIPRTHMGNDRYCFPPPQGCRHFCKASKLPHTTNHKEGNHQTALHASAHLPYTGIDDPIVLKSTLIRCGHLLRIPFPNPPDRKSVLDPQHANSIGMGGGGGVLGRLDPPPIPAVCGATARAGLPQAALLAVPARPPPCPSAPSSRPRARPRWCNWCPWRIMGKYGPSS